MYDRSVEAETLDKPAGSLEHVQRRGPDLLFVPERCETETGRLAYEAGDTMVRGSVSSGEFVLRTESEPPGPRGAAAADSPGAAAVRPGGRRS